MGDVLIDLDSEGMLNEIEKTSKDVAVVGSRLIGRIHDIDYEQLYPALLPAVWADLETIKDVLEMFDKKLRDLQ